MVTLEFDAVAEIIRDSGFTRIPEFLDSSTIDSLIASIRLMEREYYTDSNLDTGAVLFSDATETRVSHAMMCALGEAQLPTVPILTEALRELLHGHNAILGEILGKSVPDSARSMLNFQRYLGKSKLVAEHFDGHYSRYIRKGPYEFELVEGLLPRYVFVYTLTNENTGFPQGTHLRDTNTHETFTPLSRPGDLLIFDNVRFRHSVLELPKPREMLGFRCFDVYPYHFVRMQPVDSADYGELADLVNPGFVRAMSSSEGMEHLSTFYKTLWPAQLRELRQGGGLF